MPDSREALPRTPRRIGVAADHGGFESKEYLVRMLREAHYEVVDFGDSQPKPEDDYPDFVVPLARAVARGEVDRGVAVCGSGVGACIAANKVPARHLGAPRWVNSRQDVRLEDPPKSIQTKGGGGTRTVLTAFAAEAPREVLGALEGSSTDDPKEAIRLIGLHLKWDPEESSGGRAWRTFLADVRDQSQ